MYPAAMVAQSSSNVNRLSTLTTSSRSSTSWRDVNGFQMGDEDDEDEEDDELMMREKKVLLVFKFSILIFQSCTFKKDARCIGVSDEL